MLTDKEKKELTDLMSTIVTETVKPLADSLKALELKVGGGAPVATLQERTYLEERGWVEVTAAEGGPGRQFNQRAGWLDMRPPGPKMENVREIVDPKTNQLVRTVRQLATSGGIAAWHSLLDALAAERKRNRDPLPEFEIAEVTGMPPFEEKKNPVHLQRWVIRDRGRRALTEQFRFRKDAEDALDTIKTSKPTLRQEVA